MVVDKMFGQVYLKVYRENSTKMSFNLLRAIVLSIFIREYYKENPTTDGYFGVWIAIIITSLILFMSYFRYRMYYNNPAKIVWLADSMNHTTHQILHIPPPYDMSSLVSTTIHDASDPNG